MLNSKTEYNRCHIARLRVEEESDTKKREESIREEDEQIARELDREQQSWEQERTRIKDNERRVTAMTFGSTDVRLRSKKSKSRREEPPGSIRKTKRRKYVLMPEDWGAPSTTAPRSTLLLGERPDSTGSRELSELVSEQPPPRPTEGAKVGGGEEDGHHSNATQNTRASPDKPCKTKVPLVDQDGPGPRAVNTSLVEHELEGGVSLHSFDDTIFERPPCKEYADKEATEGEYEYLVSKGLDSHHRGVGEADTVMSTTPSTIELSNFGNILEEVSNKEDIQNGNTSDELCIEKKEATQNDVQMMTREDMMMMRQGDDEGVINTDDIGGGMGDTDRVEECTFKRGTCITHKLKGKKITHTNKFWTKKKDGMFGWSYRRKIVYECEFKPSTDLSPSYCISPTYVGGGATRVSASDFVQILGSYNTEKTESESFIAEKITPTEARHEDI